MENTENNENCENYVEKIVKFRIRRKRKNREIIKKEYLVKFAKNDENDKICHQWLFEDIWPKDIKSKKIFEVSQKKYINTVCVNSKTRQTYWD